VAADAHLQMIQAVITRLSAQSTTIKGWCVTVTAALLGLSANATSPAIAIIAFYVVISFAVLDAYYLAVERAHRVLYERTVAGQVPQWSLTISRPTLRQTLRALRSPSIALLYGASLGATAALTAFIVLK
jgi:hypothetical protein